MEWLDGRVFHEFATPGVSHAPSARELYRSMCATLAEIHKLDFRALGLGDFGKPRQLLQAPAQPLVGALVGHIARATTTIPDLDRIVRWLSERVPESETLRSVPRRLPHRQRDVPQDRAARDRRAGLGAVDARPSAGRSRLQQPGVAHGARRERRPARPAARGYGRAGGAGVSRAATTRSPARRSG